MLTPSGCQHCGVERQEHFQRWTTGAGWHKWTAPTQAQILARMKARRAERLVPKVAPVADPRTFVTLTANTGSASETMRAALDRLGPPCIPDHGSGGWCPGCAYDPTES